jgi:hypothetical protein
VRINEGKTSRPYPSRIAGLSEISRQTGGIEKDCVEIVAGDGNARVGAADFYCALLIKEETGCKSRLRKSGAR